MKQPDVYLEVDISQQRLRHWAGGQVVRAYLVSTAKNGPGELLGSECTPTGWHKIRAKIGQGQPSGAVFVGRRPTGEIYLPELSLQHPHRDWILSRILWLNGSEPGKNRYGNVDSGWRYIYIHGSPDPLVSGVPDSHGCVRMKNADVIDLFERVEVGCPVFIHV